MAATVTLTNLGTIAPIVNIAAVGVSVDANSVSYATSLGGLAIDLYSVLNAATPFGSPIPKIIGVQPLATSAPGKFVPLSLSVGTVTTTSIPCYVRFIAGATAATGFTEIADGACTQTVGFLVLVARGGTN